jgi:hypothetical protein
MMTLDVSDNRDWPGDRTAELLIPFNTASDNASFQASLSHSCNNVPFLRAVTEIQAG